MFEKCVGYSSGTVSDFGILLVRDGYTAAQNTLINQSKK